MQSSNYPPLPAAKTDTFFSFYPYPISSRASTHASLRTSSTQERRTGLFNPESKSPPSAGPSQPLGRHERRQAHSRAEKRALRAQRPAGVALGADAMDLSDEEAQLDEEKHELNHFGHRFLIPIGRRITQMESEAAPVSVYGTTADGSHQRRATMNSGRRTAMA